MSTRAEMRPATDGLFRAEALVFRRRRSEGRTRLATPPAAWWLCSLLVAAMIAGLLFLATASYTRKATVPGYIETDLVTKRVYAAVSGTIVRIFVRSGESVKRHQRLAILATASAIDDKDRQKMLESYDSQLRDAEKRLAAQHEAGRIAKAALLRKQMAAKHALVHLARMQHLQKQKLEQLEKTERLARPLYRAGSLSRLEWEHLAGSVVDAEQHMEQLAADASERSDQLAGIELSLQQQAVKARQSSAALRQEISRIRQSRRSLAAGARTTVTSQLEGQVADLYVQPGDRVSSSRPLLSISPVHARLVARLMIPSSAAGRVRVGQRVTFLYDAFPYQQFGVYSGRILSLSRHALLPGDEPIGAGASTPYFEAIARIPQPWVMVNGKRVGLRAGMSLKADIRVSRRSLLRWIVDPLNGLGSRGP